MDFLKFLNEEDVIVEYGIIKFRDRRRKCRFGKNIIPIGTPHIINEICDILDCLNMKAVSVKQVDFPVLVAYIQRHTGYSKKWSYIIANSILDISMRFG